MSAHPHSQAVARELSDRARRAGRQARCGCTPEGPLRPTAVGGGGGAALEDAAERARQVALGPGGARAWARGPLRARRSAHMSARSVSAAARRPQSVILARWVVGTVKQGPGRDESEPPTGVSGHWEPLGGDQERSCCEGFGFEGGGADGRWTRRSGSARGAAGSLLCCAACAAVWDPSERCDGRAGAVTRRFLAPHPVVLQARRPPPGHATPRP